MSKKQPASNINPANANAVLKKTPKNTDNRPVYKSPIFIGLGLVFLFLFILYASYLFLFGGEKKKAVSAAPVKPTPEQMQAAQSNREPAVSAELPPAETTEDEAVLMAQTATPVIVPQNDYTLSQTPIHALCRQSTTDIWSDLTDYSIVGQNVVSQRGYLPINSPTLMDIEAKLYGDCLNFVDKNNLLIERNDSAGNTGWYIYQQGGETAADEAYEPITNADAAAQLRNAMRSRYKQGATSALNTAEFMQATAPVKERTEEKMNESDRQEFLNIISTQRQKNLELQAENKELREEQRRVRQDVINLVQKIEDSAAANARIRATMIPSNSGWDVMAVVGNRIYLKNQEGRIETITQGDKLPDSNLVVSGSQAGLVLVTPAN